MQHDTIHNRQAMGVPLEEKFLPQYLREQGYKTHAIGKVGYIVNGLAASSFIFEI